MHLVPPIAEHYAKYTGLEQQELESYGYEGLIFAVDNFLPDKNASFILYARTCIRGLILRGIASLYGFRNNLYYKYLHAKEDVEDKHKQSISENISLIDEVVDSLIQDGTICKQFREGMKIKILYLLRESLTIHKDEFIQNENDLFYQATIDFRNEAIEKILDRVITDKQKETIISRFGLQNHDTKTLAELAQQWNVSDQCISSREYGAIEALARNTRVSKKLKPILDMFDEYNCSSTPVMELFQSIQHTHNK